MPKKQGTVVPDGSMSQFSRLNAFPNRLSFAHEFHRYIDVIG